jgi:hypothetical protein
MIDVDIEGAKFRNKDHDCTLNREVITVAQGYAESENPLINSAAKVFCSEYNPLAIQAPLKVHYAPHVPGKPQDFTAEFQSNELYQGWFELEPQDTSHQST